MAIKRGVLRWAACVLLWVSGAGLQPASQPATDAAEPVSCRHIVRRGPNFSIWVATIDLADPRVAVHVARGGPDPDGNGPWVTTLLPTSEIAEREHFDIAINGDFFTAQSTHDIEGFNTGYIKGKFAKPEGMAMTNGQLWHMESGKQPYLEITAGHVARIIDGRTAGPADRTAQEMIGGGQIILRAGKAISFTGALGKARHPRTVVGVDKSGSRLTLFVVDGRQMKLSIGMTLTELSKEMLQLGCEDALNLDGGGSTTLVYREAATNKLKVMNSPSDGKERAVADVLGVTVKGALPAAEQFTPSPKPESN